nr:hypothetical protein [Tanacetum cinerariifolium]
MLLYEKKAINDEIESIMGNNTLVLADVPLGCKPLGCKWNFKRKLKVDGTIEEFKARLMDVKIAFLNDDLDEEVYMNQPLGFIMSGNENKMRKLINEFDESGKGVIICLYVDDMLIFGTKQVQVYLTKEFLSLKFYMKDMQEADVILGIRIKHEMSTPMDTSEKLMPNNGQAISQLEYSRVIMALSTGKQFSGSLAMLTVDFSNAFNLVDRSALLHDVRVRENGRKGSVKAGGFEFGSLAVERKRYRWVALFSWSVERPLGTSLIGKSVVNLIRVERRRLGRDRGAGRVVQDRDEAFLMTTSSSSAKGHDCLDSIVGNYLMSAITED